MEINYERVAQYHETDQMGVIHHSNYIKWMEEARIHFMNLVGLSYNKMEEMNIISPVIEVHCQYKDMAKFEDTIIVSTKIKDYTGIKMTISYEMKNKTSGKICAIGESKHCFLNKEKKILSLSKHYPDIDKLFKSYFTK